MNKISKKVTDKINNNLSISKNKLNQTTQTKLSNLSNQSNISNLSNKPNNVNKSPIQKNQDLWINKYKPQTINQIIGNNEQIKNFKDWIVNLSENKNQGIIISGNQGL